MWSRWEARNHERYSREKLARDRAGLANRARELGPFDRLELRELQRRNGGNDLESPSDGGAAARRRPRSATDATYARLLSRSRSNSERVKAAFRKSEQARVDEAIALRETHESPSGAHGDILREGKGRRKRGTPPILRRGGDFGSSPPSRASSSRRVSISLRDLDSASSHDSRDSDAEASLDSDAAASLSSATGSEDDRTEIRSYGDSATLRRRRSPRRSRAARRLGVPDGAKRFVSPRKRVRGARPRAKRVSARRRASHRDAPRSSRRSRRDRRRSRARSPWRSPRTTRFSPSPATTCPAGRARQARATRSPSGSTGRRTARLRARGRRLWTVAGTPRDVEATPVFGAALRRRSARRVCTPRAARTSACARARRRRAPGPSMSSPRRWCWRRSGPCTASRAWRGTGRPHGAAAEQAAAKTNLRG